MARRIIDSLSVDQVVLDCHEFDQQVKNVTERMGRNYLYSSFEVAVNYCTKCKFYYDCHKVEQYEQRKINGEVRVQ